MKTKLLIVTAACVAFSMIASLVRSDATYAANCPQNRDYCNGAEGWDDVTSARRACGNGSGDYGAIWFNNSGSAPTNDTNGYYSGYVYVNASANTVSVTIRGSVVACRSSSWGDRYGTNVYPTGSNAWRLTGQNSSVLYRGRMTGGWNQWSTQGGEIRATLNVSGLATNNVGREDRQTITIGLHRCFSTNGSTHNGSCYSTAIPVTVVRAAQPIRWTLTPSVSMTSAASVNQPGQTLTWSHSIRNNGPDTTNRGITYNAQNQGHLGTGNNWNQDVTNLLSGSSHSRNSNHVITQNDVGNSLCRRTTVAPQAWNNSSTLASGNACRTIPYNYTLMPSITNITDNTVTEPDKASIPVVGSVENRGPTKSHTNIRWQTTQVVFGPNTNPTNRGGGVSTNNPCQYFASSLSCRNLASGTRSAAYPGNGAGGGSTYTTTGNATGSVDDLDAGSHVCYAFSVQRNSSSSTGWRHSALRCLIVGKQPKVQVHGGALNVGRTFNGGALVPSIVSTSVTEKRPRAGSGNVFGSWAEYGIFAPSRVVTMASASGLNLGSTSSNQSTWSLLTYANTSPASPCTSSQFGCYRTGDAAIPDVAASFPTIGASSITASPRSLSQLASAAVSSSVGDSKGGVITTSLGTLDISGGTIGGSGQRGRWIVLHAPNTTVNITGNLQYTGDSLSNMTEIPQLIIIARNINIRHNVQRVDGWLIARGTTVSTGQINTCSTNNSGGSLAVTAALTTNLCANKLTVNGPVMANKLHLRRTHGSFAGNAERSSEPAEVFNLRPDAYLWVRQYLESGNALRTVNTTELPPRF